jgi:hypothetical protein
MGNAAADRGGFGLLTGSPLCSQQKQSLIQEDYRVHSNASRCLAFIPYVARTLTPGLGCPVISGYLRRLRQPEEPRVSKSGIAQNVGPPRPCP